MVSLHDVRSNAGLTLTDMCKGMSMIESQVASRRASVVIVACVCTSRSCGAMTY